MVYDVTQDSEYDSNKNHVRGLFMLQNKSWGLVLSGGGGKGAYEVGVLKALAEKKVPITAVSGTSVGALNAALFATYDVNSMIEIWKGIRPEIALSQEALGDLIRLNAIPRLIRSSRISCYVNAYNLFTGKNDEFRLNNYRGEDVVNILLASAAMPIIYPPINFNNTLYWDGGLLDNTPIDILYRQGYRNLLVIYLSPDEGENEYKDANLITFSPKEKWGFLEGTLNFDSRDIRERIEMGYWETRRKLEGKH